MQNYLNLFTLITLISVSLLANADAPKIKSATPVIYLADNLDEKDELGWCIDTLGRGFAEILQAHSCKPARGKASDTQFSYDKESGQLRSVAFEGKCAALNKPEDKQKPFGLIDCSGDDASQKFVYETESMQIQIGKDKSQCMIVSSNSSSAGPFMSRKLVYASCSSIEDKYKQWTIRQ